MKLTDSTPGTYSNLPGRAIEYGTLVSRSSSGHRQAAELILRRCSALPAPDCVLIKAIYDGGQTAAQVARLCGGSARVLRRRVHRLVKRLMSREFVFVLGNRARWSPTRR